MVCARLTAQQEANHKYVLAQFQEPVAAGAVARLDRPWLPGFRV